MPIFETRKQREKRLEKERREEERRIDKQKKEQERLESKAEKERLRAEDRREKLALRQKQEAEKTIAALEKREIALALQLTKLKNQELLEEEKRIEAEKKANIGKRKKQIKPILTKEEIKESKILLESLEQKRADILKKLTSAQETELGLLNEELAEVGEDIKYVEKKLSDPRAQTIENKSAVLQSLEAQLADIRKETNKAKKELAKRKRNLGKLGKVQNSSTPTESSTNIGYGSLRSFDENVSTPKQRQITGKGLVSAAKSIGSVATASGFVLGGEHTQKLLGTAIAAKMAIGQLSSDYEGIRRGSGSLLGTSNSNRRAKDPAVDAIEHSEERIVTAIQTTNERLIDKQAEANKIAKDTLDFQEDNAKNIQENAEQANRAIRSFRNAGESPSANMAKRLNPDGSPKEANKGWLASIGSAFSNPLSTIGGLFAGKKLLGLGKGALGMIPKTLGSIGKALMGGGLLASGASVAGKALSTGSKVVGSVAAKTGTAVAKSAPAIAKTITKTGVQGLTKIVGSSMLKKVPILGAIAGGAYAIGRALTGDYEGAGLELASGAASTIPGIGTGASIAIDAYSIKRDLDREAATLEVSQAQLSQSKQTPAPVRPTYEGIPQPSAAPGPSVQNTQSSVAQRPLKPAPVITPTHDIKSAITAVATTEGIDPAHFMAMAGHESGMNTKAVSPTGARGLFQFTRGTGREYAKKLGFTGDLKTILEDPVKNSQMAARLYKDNLNYLRPTMKQVGFADEQTAAYLGHNIGMGGATNFLKQYGRNPNAQIEMTREMKHNPANFKPGDTYASAMNRISNIAGAGAAEKYRGQVNPKDSGNMGVLNKNIQEREQLDTRMNRSKPTTNLNVNNINQRGNNNSGQTTARKAHVQPRYEEPTILTLMFQTLSGVVS
jgi:hypothetical protein